jgi:hypothetical protein
MIFNDISIMCVTNIDDIDEMYLSMIMMISTINNNNMYIYLNIVCGVIVACVYVCINDNMRVHYACICDA